MSTSSFRLFFIGIGMLIAMSIAKMFDIEIYKVISVVSFLVAMDYLASGIIVRMLMAQNKDLVNNLTKLVNKELDNERNDSETR